MRCIPIPIEASSVWGLNVAPGMVEHARELNPTLDIRSGDVERLPFDDALFDYVISIEVIRYLADPQKALREFHLDAPSGGHRR